MNVFRKALLGAAILAVAAPALAADDMKSDKMAMTKTFTFAAQNGSGESGTVTLAPAADDSTTVTIALKGGPAEAQPAHIHDGSCAKLDPKPKYPLKNVVDGASTTVVKASMKTLDAGGFAVNVHKSTSDIATYVACADLGTAKMMPGTSASPMMMPAPSASP